LERALTYVKKGGRTPVIWVDDGQKLSFSHIALLLGLTDVTTATGTPCCKEVIAGTGGLQTMHNQGADNTPDEGAAIEGRCGLYTMALKPWSVDHVDAWLNRVCHAVANPTTTPTNPFGNGAGAAIHKRCRGKPRMVVQIVELVLLAKAKQFGRTPAFGVGILDTDIAAIMRQRCECAQVGKRTLDHRFECGFPAAGLPHDNKQPCTGKR